MSAKSLLLEMFSRTQFDRNFSAETLAFLFEYGGGVLQPQECGVYEPFEPCEPSSMQRYVSWLTSPGGEFGFRRATPSLEGHISNLLQPEILVREEGATLYKSLPPVTPPVFGSRWRLQFGSDFSGPLVPDFIKKLLCDVAHLAHADYGFVALDEDHRKKHFQSIRKDRSLVQQYIGNNPEHGIPGLYWLNFFGRLYVEYFTEEKLSAVARHAAVFSLAGEGIGLQFGRSPEESLSPDMLEQQRIVVDILGENAFFDIHQPERVPDVPPALQRDRD